jgi:nucleoside-diphosphate-sugar epimerase
MSAPRILITGASGFTGQHAVKHFSAIGMDVTAVVRCKGRLMDQALNDCKIVTCDLTDRQQMELLIQAVRPEYVLHLAGRNSVFDSWNEPVNYVETNMMSTIYLLDALRRLDLASSRILIVGSMLNFNLSASPKPPHPYSLSKTFQVIAAQSWGTLFHQQIMVAQPSNLIGAGYSNGICGLLANYIARRESGTEENTFRLSSLTEVRDFLDVRDAVHSYEKILLQGLPNSVYCIGSGLNRSLGDMIQVFQSIAAIPLQLEIGHVKNRSAPDPIDLSAIRGLGWKPVIPFEQSIKDSLQFYRSHV